jgi:hypothetical protein
MKHSIFTTTLLKALRGEKGSIAKENLDNVPGEFSPLAKAHELGAFVCQYSRHAATDERRGPDFPVVLAVGDTRDSEAAPAAPTLRRSSKRVKKTNKPRGESTAWRRVRQSKDDKKALKRASNRAGQGECVFRSLLAGALGLEGLQLTTHAGLVKYIRGKFHQLEQRADRSWQDVAWNGVSIGEEERREVAAAVPLVKVGNGYFCAACDPLLVAYCAVLNVNVEIELAGNQHTYAVAHPRRIVVLRSSSTHMDFVESFEAAVAAPYKQ